MCGIVGIVSSSSMERDRLDALTNTMCHRGPDDHGIWLSQDRAVGLGHRRLAVIDTSSAGRNPMAWDGGRLQITYNGEIYNFKELRAELAALGDRFYTNTDTEVILAAYDRWGVDCLSRLIGMFAFGIWDSVRNHLFLARDRLGQKPLYYSEHNGGLIFASELKAIAADADFSREIDPDALGMYLRYGYVPAPLTIYHHAKKLPPAYYAIYKDGCLTTACYWDPVELATKQHEHIDVADGLQHLEYLLQDSVRSQMLADVPLGAFLSGGIDSSLIVALMQEQSSRAVKTFSIRFDNPAYNEADHAQAVARHLRTEHYEETCNSQQMIDIIGSLPEYFDEPFADASAIPTYMVSRIARKSVTVALSGDGGDELFFGYERYHNFMTRWLAMAAPQQHGGLKEDALDRELAYYAHWHVSWQAPEIAFMLGRPAQRSTGHEAARRELQRFAPLERPALLDLLTYLPEQILTKVDRASMAVSLEARAPFLDHRVVEFALRLPFDQKWRHGESKWLLRQMLYKRVPRSLVDRPKMGFSVPLAELLNSGLREVVDARFACHSLEGLGLDPRPVHAMWQSFLAGDKNQADKIWTLFALVSWARRWSA